MRGCPPAHCPHPLPARSMARAALLTASQCATYDELKLLFMRNLGWEDNLQTHFAGERVGGRGGRVGGACRHGDAERRAHPAPPRSEHGCRAGHHHRHCASGHGQDQHGACARMGVGGWKGGSCAACAGERARLPTRRDPAPPCAAQFVNPSYSGPWHCVRDIYRRQGVRGLFKGWGANWARQGPMTVRGWGGGAGRRGRGKIVPRTLTRASLHAQTVIFVVNEHLRHTFGLEGL